MFSQLHSNLIRQQKGLELLESLLSEEFELLLKRDTENISNLEFSLHELLRQLAVERTELKEVMNGVRISEYCTMLPEDESKEMKKTLALLDAAEQRCAKQASQNTQLSLSLLDQSHELLTFLHEQVVPKPQLVYGSKGRFTNPRPEAALLSGRM